MTAQCRERIACEVRGTGERYREQREREWDAEVLESRPERGGAKDEDPECDRRDAESSGEHGDTKAAIEPTEHAGAVVMRLAQEAERDRGQAHRAELQHDLRELVEEPDDPYAGWSEQQRNDLPAQQTSHEGERLRDTQQRDRARVVERCGAVTGRRHAR